MDIDDLRNLLKEEVATVTFTKVNGELREMQCTLMPEYLPFQEQETLIKYGVSPFIITVLDLEHNAWRSFKYDSIIKIETDRMQYNVVKS